MADNYGIALLAVVPCRLEPSDRSEMVSQLLFGEAYEVLEESEKWIKIWSIHDEYLGWIDRGQHTPLPDRSTADHKKMRTLLDPFNYLKRPDESLVPITAGALLPIESGSDSFELAGQQFQVAHQMTVGPVQKDQIVAFGTRLLNTPYLWGGRSAFGIDCSGYVQLLFRAIGIDLPRDAAQQVHSGTAVNDLSAAKAGDLAFFENDSGKVHHVGLLIGNGQILHASSRVKVEKISEAGIHHESKEKLTHRLHAIRRIV